MAHNYARSVCWRLHKSISKTGSESYTASNDEAARQNSSVVMIPRLGESRINRESATGKTTQGQAYKIDTLAVK